MLGSLIGTGISILGGLFGGNSKKKAQEARDKHNVEAIRTANETNNKRAEDMNADVRARADEAAKVPVETYSDSRTENWSKSESAGGFDADAFLAAADKTGINPISMMRSGMGSLFATNTSVGYSGSQSTGTTKTYGERAMDAALAGQNIYYDSPETLSGDAPQSTGETIGNALQSAGAAFSDYSAQQAQNDHQRAMLQDKLNAQASSSGSNVSTGGGGGGSGSGGAAVTTAGSFGGSAGSGMSSGGDENEGGVTIGGVEIENAPGWSDAQTIEDEYGDVAGSAYGAARGAADAGNYLRKNATEGSIGDYLIKGADAYSDASLGVYDWLLNTPVKDMVPTVTGQPTWGTMGSGQTQGGWRKSHSADESQRAGGGASGSW